MKEKRFPMNPHNTDIKNPDTDFSYDPENIPLHQRPSISIRAKIALSFALFFILSFTVTGWSYWILTKLEHKIDFL
jgi:two-component system, NtrC family, sensor kinase